LRSTPKNSRNPSIVALADDGQIAVTSQTFIVRWQHAGDSELANAGRFVRELAELPGKPPLVPSAYPACVIGLQHYCHVGRRSWLP